MTRPAVPKAMRLAELIVVLRDHLGIDIAVSRVSDERLVITSDNDPEYIGDRELSALCAQTGAVVVDFQYTPTLRYAPTGAFSSNDWRLTLNLRTVP